MLPSGKKVIFPKPLHLTAGNMSKNEIWRATINGLPCAKQGKNLISVCVLYNVIKLASGEGFEIKFLSQSL